MSRSTAGWAMQHSHTNITSMGTLPCCCPSQHSSSVSSPRALRDATWEGMGGDGSVASYQQTHRLHFGGIIQLEPGYDTAHLQQRARPLDVVHPPGLLHRQRHDDLHRLGEDGSNGH